MSPETHPERARVAYDQGTLRIEAWPSSLSLPRYVQNDPRIGLPRCFALHYRHLQGYAEKADVTLETSWAPFAPLHPREGSAPSLRPYQEEAVSAWHSRGGRGIVVLPTGSGKTRVAVEAMGRVGLSTLVVVPTLELLAQWHSILCEAFHGEVGRLGGGEHEVLPLTVTTYDSAYRWLDRYGDRFAFLLFDEVHHLPAPTYLQIAQMSVAPYRLGLTATFERSDFRHVALSRWVGPVVYRKAIDDLADDTLAPYRTEVHRLFLTPEEQAEFDQNKRAYKAYLRERGWRGPKAFEKLVREAGLETPALVALNAFQAAQRVVANAASKLDFVGRMLGRYPNRRMLIFTEFNDLVYRISRKYFLPAITHRTSPGERRWILRAFRDGKLKTIVTSKVLNEGVDVPEADIALVLSGSGSRREHVQRLGRILRSAPSKEALLLEAVTSEEAGLSRRRRNDSAFQAPQGPIQETLFPHADI